MDLAQHTDQPTPFMIGGVEYLLSELTIASLGRLQAWIKTNVPHPIDAIKPHLAGLDSECKAILLDQARKESQSWPPIMGTQAAARLLSERPDFQVELFWEGLKQHKADATRTEAERLFRKVRDSQEKSRAILACLFGRNPSEDEGSDGPKGPAGDPIPSTGT